MGTNFNMWRRLLILLFLTVAVYGQETSALKGWLRGWATKPNIPILKHGNKTYFFGTYKATFLQAMQFCDIMYMKLLTIDTEEENDIILKYITETSKGNDYWTSGSNLLDSRNFVWMSTGKTVEYSKWNNNEPSYNGENCIELLVKNNQLFWNDVNCNNKMNYICQREDGNEKVTTQTSYSPNINLLRTVGKTFYFSRNFKLNYLDAAFFCRMLHMTLVTINSQEENQDIENYIKNTNVGKHFWTAGTKILDNQWIWFTSGQRVEYARWAKNIPNDNKQNCIGVVYSEEDGLKWYDYPCTDEYSFICEKATHPQKQRKKRNPEYFSEQASLTVSDEDWQAALEELPPGFIAYTYNAGKKYHIETDMWGTQKQAKMFCEYHQMQLLAIESELENNITKKVLLDAGDDVPYWIAAKKPTNDWRWLRIGKPLTYTNLERHTNLAADGTTCLSILVTGEWQVEDCDNARPFICEAAETEIPEEIPEQKCDPLPPPPVPVVQRVCAVKPVINVYINNNLITSGAATKLLEKGFETEGKYSVDIKNNF